MGVHPVTPLPSPLAAPVSRWSVLMLNYSGGQAPIATASDHEPKMESYYRCLAEGEERP